MFLFPLYLAGAAALAVPIIVHLRNRRTAQVLRFPTLRFLTQATVVSTRWRTIMRWLVLLLRLAALAALVLAFAQPWLRAAPSAPGAARVLLVDVSASMQAGDAWKEARAAALGWLGRQSADTRVSVVAIDRRQRQLSGFADGAARQVQVVEALAAGCAGSDLDAALRFADRLLADQPSGDRGIVLVSDCAAAACRDLAFHQPLSPGIALEVLAVAAATPRNLAVTAIDHPAALWRAGAPVEITAEVRNFTDQARDVEVRLALAGADGADAPGPALVRTAALPPHGTARVGFGLSAPAAAPGAVRPAGLAGRISINRTESGVRSPESHGSGRRTPDAAHDKDDFALDDERPFAIAARRALVAGALVGPGWDHRFAAAASAPGDAGDRFAWREIAGEADLAGCDLLLVDFAFAGAASGVRRPEPTGSGPRTAVPSDSGRRTPDAARLDEALRAWLAAGRPALVVLGDAAALPGWASGVLPLTLDGLEQRNELLAAERVAVGDLRHAILHPFAQPQAGDLGGFAVKRWRRFALAGGRPLMLLGGGDPWLAVAEAPGRLAVLAAPPDRAWSDWPAHATFLPVWQQTLGWLAEGGRSGRRLLVGAPGVASQRPGLERLADGSWQAVELDPAESDPARWTASDAFARLRNPADATAVAAVARADQERAGRDLAWWLLVAVAVFAALELALANRTPR